MSLQCEFCGKPTSSVNIRRHQKSKGCLRAQEKQIGYQGFSCSDCGINISREDRLPHHQKICTPYLMRITEERVREEYFHLEEELETSRAIQEELLEEVKELRATLAAKPTININTNTTNNTLNIIQASFQAITQKQLDDHGKSISDHDILTGGVGVALHSLKVIGDNVLCSDIARRKLKYYKDNKVEGIYTDPKGKHLSKMCFRAVKKKADKVTGEIICDPEVDDKEWKEEILKLNRGYARASRGESSKLHSDFIDEVCAKTYAKNQHLITA